MKHLLGSETNPEVKSFVFSAGCLPAIYLMRLLLKGKSNILLAGPTGVGKTVLARAVLHSAGEWVVSEDAVKEALEKLKEREQEAVSSAQAAPEWAEELSRSTQDLQGLELPDSATPTPILSSVPSIRYRPPPAQDRINGPAPLGINPFEIMYSTVSSQSKASDVRKLMESFLTKRKRGVLGPPVGKTGVMLIDDLHAAGIDQFSTQPAVELLRQWCGKGGWHDEEAGVVSFKHVVDTLLLSCITTSPYQKTVSDRFLQHISLIALPTISQSSLQLIFTALLRRYMQSTTTVASTLMPALVSGTLELYKLVTGHLLPIPSRPHYIFSIRHVAAIFKGMFICHRDSRNTPANLVLLWQHECARVLQDRIADPSAREWFNKTLHTVSQTSLGELAPLDPPTGNDVLFCTFASRGGNLYELAENVLRPNRFVTQGEGESSPVFSPRGPMVLPEHLSPRGAGSAHLLQDASSPLSSPRAFDKISGLPSPPVIKKDDALPDANVENPLHRLYGSEWVDDGVTTLEQAACRRLMRILSLYSQEQLVGSRRASDYRGSVSGQRQPARGETDEGGVVIFKQALMHVARITRVLSMDQGHMILLGSAGSGRRTLCRLAAHICSMQLFEVNLKDSQSGVQWKDLLKNLIHTSGVQGRPSCLLLADIARPADTMLDDVNQLMSTGHLPGLFTSEDIDTIIQSIKPAAKTSGIYWSDTDRTGSAEHVLYQYFIDRCRSNIHILLVLESQEQSMQSKITKFPKMFHLASVNHMDDWSADAKTEVAKSILVSSEELLLPSLVFQEVVSSVVEMHSSVTRVAGEGY